MKSDDNDENTLDIVAAVGDTAHVGVGAVVVNVVGRQLLWLQHSRQLCDCCCH